MNRHETFEGGLTVIVPIRCSNDRQDAIHRLQFLLQAAPIPPAVQFLVVDDGSPRQIGKEIEAACDRLGLEYLRLESELETFSIGRARNAGVQRSRTKYVLFQDVDLLPYPGFYSDVLIEIEVQELHKYAERFLMFGVIYLTKSGTDEFLSTPPAVRKSKFVQYLLDADASRIEKFSTGTSVTVWRRDYFLGAGGNDPEFEGWGYEDLEFTCRAIRRARRFPLPEEFGLDYKNFQTINEYRGWKSIYRLFGDITFQKGYVLFHAWHPVEEGGIYVKAKDRNRRLFEEKLERFRLHGEEPDPLPMPERGRSVIFRANPWVYNRWAAPMLGEIVFADEDMFTPDSFVEYLRERAIDRVVFHNPYANERMRAIYERVRSLDIEYIVCERGALPGSVFFDPLGFNGESGSYDPGKWRRELSQEEVARLSAYVSHYKVAGDSLEDQPKRIGAQGLKRKLGLAPGRKVLFVPLQRPTDSVIEHLCGPIGSYENFLRLIRRLVFCLPPEWVVVVKRHPLEVENPDLPGFWALRHFVWNPTVTMTPGR
ncbi:glycosyltransferase [Caldimonas manganoxidans]|uniref:glycosyltransferase n=1 Tax=Caldimonas manganoxidans TaxID=196015 RepID=UPI0003762BF6|nr:glycosyltransferase [Caldimonas manganoxidans]